MDKNATEANQEVHERDTNDRVLRHTMARFVEKWQPTADRRGQADFHADLLILIQEVHKHAMLPITKVLHAAYSITGSAFHENTQPKDGWQRLNARTLESILGLKRYQAYLESLYDLSKVTMAEAAKSEFMVSRAVNFDSGNFTDLGCMNIVIYNDRCPRGFNIVVDDPSPKQIHPIVDGSGKHVWRICSCSACVTYRDIQSRDTSKG